MQSWLLCMPICYHLDKLHLTYLLTQHQHLAIIGTALNDLINAQPCLSAHLRELWLTKIVLQFPPPGPDHTCALTCAKLSPGILHPPVLAFGVSPHIPLRTSPKN